MEKSIVTHRLTLNMESQAVQATITLAQWDQATHRLIVTLRNGAETVELPPGSYAIAVQNTDAGVDVLDTVTVYGAESAYPNCIVYDVSSAITEKAGYHEAQFLISCVDENGSLQSLASPRIAFVVKPDIMRSSDVENSEPYAAVVAAQAVAEKARDDIEEHAAVAAEVNEEYQLVLTYADGHQTTSESLKGPQGSPGKDGVSVKSIIKTDTNDLVDTYTVTLTDGTTSTYTVTNGKDGKDGTDGKDGDPGPQGDPYTLAESDKQAIVDAVVAALPVYDGEVVTV